MSAKKPTSLITKHIAKTDRQRRAAAEGAITPRLRLRIRPPARLRDHQVAAELWSQTVGFFAGLDVTLVNRADTGLILDYCVLTEQLQEMDKLRKDALRRYNRAVEKLPNAMDTETKAKILEGMKDIFLKIDSRVDKKRKLLLELRQALFMTPRSRAGVNPPAREPKQPPSEMARIIDGTFN